MVIPVTPRIGKNFGDSISEIFRLISLTNTYLQYDDNITYDLSNCTFSNPFLLAGLHLIAKSHRKSGREITFKTDCLSGYKSYIDLVNFPAALETEQFNLDEFRTYMASYAGKTYIPIISFPTSNLNNDSVFRNNVLSVLNRIIKQQCNLPTNMWTAVVYLIDEAVNNILEHSKDDRGVIFAQYYPQGCYLDICIGDTGIGILQSYKNAGRGDILDDRQGMIEAAMGVSTKNLPDSRGFGINTSKNMLAQGLQGKYFLLSGNSAHIKTVSEDAVFNVPQNVRWNGTVLFMRIPVAANAEFNYLDYIDTKN